MSKDVLVFTGKRDEVGAVELCSVPDVFFDEFMQMNTKDEKYFSFPIVVKRDTPIEFDVDEWRMAAMNAKVTGEDPSADLSKGEG